MRVCTVATSAAGPDSEAEFVAQAAGIQAQLGKDRGVVLAAHIHRVRELLRAWLAWAY